MTTSSVVHGAAFPASLAMPSTHGTSCSTTKLRLLATCPRTGPRDAARNRDVPKLHHVNRKPSGSDAANSVVDRGSDRSLAVFGHEVVINASRNSGRMVRDRSLQSPSVALQRGLQRASLSSRQRLVVDGALESQSAS